MSLHDELNHQWDREAARVALDPDLARLSVPDRYRRVASAFRQAVERVMQDVESHADLREAALREISAMKTVPPPPPEQSASGREPARSTGPVRRP